MVVDTSLRNISLMDSVVTKILKMREIEGMPFTLVSQSMAKSYFATNWE